MDDQFTRLRWVAGNDSIDIMKTKHVAVFGCGGVGGYVIEGLVRSGIGTIDVFDHHYGSATLTKQFVIVEQATSNGILDGSDSDDSRVTLDILKHFLKGCTTNQLYLLTLEVFMRSNVME